MVKFLSEKVMDAFSSMKTTDSISLESNEDIKRLEKYYIDPFNYVNNIMQEEDNFIIGRRGTGKSTLIYRAFAECINSWDKGKKIYKKNILPIFIDLSKCEILTQKIDEDIIFEEYFTYELVRAFRKYINLLWPYIISSVEEDEDKSKLFNIREYMDQLDELIKKDVTYTKKWKYTLGEFLDKIALIKELSNATAIYIFVDEYSELSSTNQKILGNLLKRLRGTRRGIYFKVCAITDNYDLGEIRLQRDFYEISLDLYKFIERSNGLNDAFNRLEKFTSNIVQERLNVFGCETDISSIFNDYSQSISLLTRASIGIPRTIGIILKEAWAQAQAKKRIKISNDDLMFGIKSAGDSYYGFFSGNVGPVIPKLYDDIFEEILTRARQERKVNSKKFASMFLVGGFRDSHFKYLTENYLIHLLKKDETSVKGETNLSLYMIDLAFINKYNIGFGLDRDVYRQQRFVYNDIMKKYDVYFTNTRKEYRCPQCDTEYTQEQLFLPQLNTYLEFCLRDRHMLVKIDGIDEGNQTFTEMERKIIGTIRSRTVNDAILARDVSEIVGCNKIKVAKFAEKVEKENLIKRERLDGNNSPYRYYRGK
ncbi:hypothetical protein [Clostridium tagluense]|uniref:Uncharacterized protein n=1 Tax=Clostridium tagluense TaxID=360422 RepID=A0A401URU6_9CLOT|nr:hypothetical protein [Clostridium tagluense]GCD12254.1 hypothetical protein Ctaglu_38770 [Clostridium tagluense]